jgi:glycosyltransferase involved in cell wall biosynthesis
VFLVPGSDGTCRAVRELLAIGTPMAVADRGMLREIVRDGVTGAVFDGSAPALAEVLKAWAAEPDLRATLSAKAALDARTRFNPQTQAAEVIKTYQRLLAERFA